MSSSFPSPNIDPSLPPPLHQIGEYKFQRFVTELHGYEPNIATSSEYGRRGQADHGADVIATRTGANGLEVASCKCQEQTSAAKVVEASTQFLEHWDEHWRTKDIRRFIFATTGQNAASRDVQDQVLVERARFAALGVEYEFWGPNVLITKVRPHRTLATTYLGVPWASQICGPLPQPGITAPQNAALVSATLIEQVAELQERLSTQAQRTVERARNDLRAGRIDAVRALVENLRRDENWSQLNSTVQAMVLRLAAAIALREQNVDEADRLSTTADTIARPDEHRLAAQITLERNGSAAALFSLGEVSSAPGLQIKIALHVALGELDQARHNLARLVETDREGAETIRTQALVALASRLPEDALAHARRAEALEPEWTSVRQIGALARYACALSPVLSPEWYLAPNPFDISLVRDDVASQALLEEALGAWDRLVALEPRVDDHRLCRLAVLTSIKARRERARDEAADLLVRLDHHPAVVAWCLFRAIDVDLAESEQVLVRRYEEGADPFLVRVLSLLLAHKGKAAAGASAATIRGALDKQVGEARSIALDWLRRFDPAEVGTGDQIARDPTESALEQGRDHNDWTAAAARLAELLSTSPPDPSALPFAEAIAGADHFELLLPHIDALLTFGTSPGVRLAAHAAYRNNNPRRAITILDANAATFGEALPPDMHRLRADALARTGDMTAALREADALAGSGSAHDRLFRAELMTAAGNIRGAIPGVREALGAGLLHGDRAFRWSRLMQTEEPALARQLLERAVATALDDRYTVVAMRDAFDLGLDAEARHLMARLHARAERGASDVRLLSVDDIPGLIAEQRAHADEVERLHHNGNIPVHLLYEHDPYQLARVYLGPNRSTDGELNPWLLRHGGRQPFEAYAVPWLSWRLVMDVTALLVATRLGLLDIVEAHPNGVTIQADIPMLLLAMENGCRPHLDAGVAERILAAAFAPPVSMNSEASVLSRVSKPRAATCSLPRWRLFLPSAARWKRRRRRLFAETSMRPTVSTACPRKALR